jgi:hypothetical protein
LKCLGPGFCSCAAGSIAKGVCKARPGRLSLGTGGDQARYTKWRLGCAMYQA